MKIKLSEWARRNSYTYRGAFGAFKSGKIAGAEQLESGAIIVEVEEPVVLEGWDQVLESFSDLEKRVAAIKLAILKLKGE